MIEAVATYRLLTGAGLLEAKEVITQMFHEDPLGATLPTEIQE